MRFSKIAGSGLPLSYVANFATDYFLLKIKFLAKSKREFTTKFAILPNACYVTFFNFHLILQLLTYFLNYTNE